jgi:hypothetical protein
MQLNKHEGERRWGLIFGFIWLLILVFYLTWDGWIFEWIECGYDGPNQHFDLDFTDMRWAVVDGELVYYSTNSIHNILYLCYIQFLVGWLGLVTGNKYLRQGAMATLAFPVIATMSTLVPLWHHAYITYIVYNVVHTCGITIGIYLFSKEGMNTKETVPYILATWVIYFFTTILMKPWPYWEYNTLAYFSANQVNQMPFYLYGLEYGIVVLIFLVVNQIIVMIQARIGHRWARAFFPLVIFTVLCVVFIAAGLIVLQDIQLGTCP